MSGNLIPSSSYTEQSKEAHLRLGRRRAAEVPHVDLAALGVHHDGDDEFLLLVEPPRGADDPAVSVSVAMAHVDASHVHPADGEHLELGRAASGRAHGADELGVACALEPVLPQLSARVEDGVGGGEDPTWIGERCDIPPLSRDD
jgi:hypothetical protein